MSNLIYDIFFRSRQLPVPPVSIRLNLWHQYAEATDTVPEEIKGLSLEEVEDYLGFCRTARFRPNPEIDFGDSVLNVEIEGNLTIETYQFREASLVRKTEQSEEDKKAGISGHIQEYPLKNECDAQILLNALKDAGMTSNNQRLNKLIQDTGDKGLPLYVLNTCPIHTLMLKWFGYENFYMFQFDYPELVDELVKTLEQLYRRHLWKMGQETPAKLILHGAHFSQSMTPVPLFKQYFLQYFKEYNKAMHEAGKKVLWHSDADLGELTNLVLEAGFDGADCLATQPLVKESITDYFDAWEGKIVCWGGLPSSIFAPEFPMDKFKSYVDILKQKTQNRSDIIIGASDNVMPGSQWEKLLYISNIFQQHQKTNHISKYY